MRVFARAVAYHFKNQKFKGHRNKLAEIKWVYRILVLVINNGKICWVCLLKFFCLKKSWISKRYDNWNAVLYIDSIDFPMRVYPYHQMATAVIYISDCYRLFPWSGNELFVVFMHLWSTARLFNDCFISILTYSLLRSTAATVLFNFKVL